MTLRTLNYGNYGIFLIMGNAGFCPSTVVHTLNAYIYTYIHTYIVPKDFLPGWGLSSSVEAEFLDIWGCGTIASAGR